MEFVTDNGDESYTLTCPYCLSEFSHTPGTSASVECDSCARPIQLLPTATHAFGAPATVAQQSAFIRGQHHAYTFGYVAVVSPLVVHISPRLWLIGRWLILTNLLLAAGVVWLNPASPVSLAVLGISYSLALVFIMVRVFLWGSLRILMSREVRFAEVIRHHYAFEQGYWESVNSPSQYVHLESNDE